MNWQGSILHLRVGGVKALSVEMHYNRWGFSNTGQSCQMVSGKEWHEPLELSGEFFAQAVLSIMNGRINGLRVSDFLNEK